MKRAISSVFSSKIHFKQSWTKGVKNHTLQFRTHRTTIRLFWSLYDSSSHPTLVNVGINLGFWETAHLPLPSPTFCPKLEVSIMLTCWLLGGVFLHLSKAALWLASLREQHNFFHRKIVMHSLTTISHHDETQFHSFVQLSNLLDPSVVLSVNTAVLRHQSMPRSARNKTCKKVSMKLFADSTSYTMWLLPNRAKTRIFKDRHDRILRLELSREWYCL